MSSTRVALALAILLASCGGSAGSDTTATTSPATTQPPASCPSGEWEDQGDGPRYLSLRDSYERATAGDVEDGGPPILGQASESIPGELMIGLAYTGCTSLAGARFEEMAWSNGIGLLLVSWHEWPRVADPSVMPFGGTAEQAGVVEVSRIEAGNEGSRLLIIRLFDGLKVVSVSSYGLTTMDPQRIEDVAWAVYDAIPVDPEGAPSRGPTVDEVLASLASEQVSVSESEPSSELSAFTLNLGAAHTSYSAVVNGTGIELYDFGIPAAARRAVTAVSTDGFSIAHMPYSWSGDPHFWLRGRVVVVYEGGDEEFVALVSEVLGDPVAPELEAADS